MNREPINCTYVAARHLVTGSERHHEQMQAWTARLVAKEQCVEPGHVFQWSRGSAVASNTAYLFDATMCSLQYAQMQLQASSSCVGKQAYTTARRAASTYANILTDLLPRWTFRPSEVYAIPDTSQHDIYGHYCLARAMAYGAVGQADMDAPDTAKAAAAANAAHMYLMAAQLIEGDTTAMVQRAQACIADTLALRGKAFLDAWNEDNDPEGAAKALACYQEAHSRTGGYADQVNYAYERNNVNWLDPVLPEFASIVWPRITAL